MQKDRDMHRLQFLTIFALLWASCSDNNKITNREILVSNDDTLYLFTKNWGMTSDKQITEISSKDFVSDDLSFDTNASYVYEGLSPFSYRLKNDTLFIYSATTYKAPVPNKFSSSIIVIQRTTNDEDYVDIRSLGDSAKVEYKSPSSTIPFDPSVQEVPKPR